MASKYYPGQVVKIQYGTKPEYKYVGHALVEKVDEKADPYIHLAVAYWDGRRWCNMGHKHGMDESELDRRLVKTDE